MYTYERLYYDIYRTFVRIPVYDLYAVTKVPTSKRIERVYFKKRWFAATARSHYFLMGKMS